MRTVFVSYRRGDSEGQARALNFELVRLIGKDAVFMDVDSIALGQDFRRVLHERLESCDLMLALIGPGWLDAKDRAGNRRLDSGTDLVRQEIAAALKRNIPVIPVLLQDAQMPPPERLPEELRELVYRNGFELGHSTWESDVAEMVKRLDLLKPSDASTRPTGVVPSAPAVATGSGRARTAWIVAAFGVLAITVAAFFYQKSREQSSGGPVDAPPQTASGAPSPESAGSARETVQAVPRQPGQPVAQTSTGGASQQPGGLGAIKIANLKGRTVEVYEQNSTAENFTVAGYAGKLSPTASTLQVPAGTYKLKFDSLFVEHVAVTSAHSPEIQLGAITLSNLTRTAEVYAQDSTAENFTVAGYVGKLSPTETTLQLPAGTYKLKFDNLFVEQVAVASAQSRNMVLGTISLPNLARSVEVYAQNSTAENFTVAGYAGKLSSNSRTLQVPAGTYKLKFDNVFVPGIRVEAGKTVVSQ